jgi:hypothetical protein
MAATLPKARPGSRKRTKEEAVREMADIILEHLAQFPPKEQERRLKSFSKRAAAMTAARAKSPRGARNPAKSR